MSRFRQIEVKLWQTLGVRHVLHVACGKKKKDLSCLLTRVQEAPLVSRSAEAFRAVCPQMLNDGGDAKPVILFIAVQQQDSSRVSHRFQGILQFEKVCILFLWN